MKYTCDRCKRGLESTVKTYGGYAVTEMKNLCPDCWEEYIEIKNRQYCELNRWWSNDI